MAREHKNCRDASPVAGFRRRLRGAVFLLMAGAVLAAPSDAGAPDAADQQSGRFQPTQKIKADTIVDFPVDI